MSIPSFLDLAHALVFTVFIVTIPLSLQVGAQQAGFISIACGSSFSNYTDSNGILWLPDHDYIDGGSNGSIQISSHNISYPLTALRYFPGTQIDKYCYLLPGLTPDAIYLLRATFLYGNYDNKNHFPSFDLLLDAYLWASIANEGNEAVINREIIFAATAKSSVSVCLARNGTDTPFISTLELRPLDAATTSYSKAISGGHALQLKYRVNYGSSSNNSVRYPDDQYDRIWAADTTPQILSTTSQIHVGSFYAPDNPPQKVLQTARVTGGQGLGSLSFTFHNMGNESNLATMLYFAEIGNVTAAGERVFYAYLNVLGDVPLDEFDVFKTCGPLTACEGAGPTPGGDPLILTLTPVTNSTLGPLLNAAEIFTISEAPLPPGTDQADVNALQSIQESLNLTEWTGDPCLPKGCGWNWVECDSQNTPRISALLLTSKNISGILSTAINLLTNLEQISLGNNRLTGPIPALSALLNLETLDLQNNELNGPIPESLAELPNLKKLFLRNNNLSGPIPQKLLNESASGSLNFSYGGNVYLCKSPNNTCVSQVANSEGTRKAKRKDFIIPVVEAIVIILLLGIIIGLIYILKKFKNKNMTMQSQSKNTDLLHLARSFLFEEIKIATNDFAKKIGEGAFGEVFHGILSQGENIAVKVLSQNSSQGFKQFFNEVAVLSRVRHKSLVALVGYCNSNSKHILIYEFISQGALRDHLYGALVRLNPLTWTMRLHIALEAAQGLEYLHVGCDPSIIHRDVKSSNILLNDKMHAKVADFGLSRLKYGDNLTHVSTVNVVGTPGYLDPAYSSTYQLTEKSDVYSFGVVLLELVCGRPPLAIDNSYNMEHIVDWIMPFIRQGNIQDVVDPTMDDHYTLDAVLKVIDIAIRSVESDRNRRPTMSEVVFELKEAVQIETRSQKYGSSSSTYSVNLTDISDLTPR